MLWWLLLAYAIVMVGMFWFGRRLRISRDVRHREQRSGSLKEPGKGVRAMSPEEFVAKVFTAMETPSGLERLDMSVLAIGKMISVQAVLDQYRDELPHVATTSTMEVVLPVWESVVHGHLEEPPC